MGWPRTCISGGGLRKHIRRRLDIRGKGTALRLRLFQLRGRAGRDLSTLGAGGAGGFLDFLRRRAIKDSWHDMQKMPCEVRA